MQTYIDSIKRRVPPPTTIETRETRSSRLLQSYRDRLRHEIVRETDDTALESAATADLSGHAPSLTHGPHKRPEGDRHLTHRPSSLRPRGHRISPCFGGQVVAARAAVQRSPASQLSTSPWYPILLHDSSGSCPPPRPSISSAAAGDIDRSLFTSNDIAVDPDIDCSPPQWRQWCAPGFSPAIGDDDGEAATEEEGEEVERGGGGAGPSTYLTSPGNAKVSDATSQQTSYGDEEACGFRPAGHALNRAAPLRPYSSPPRPSSNSQSTSAVSLWDLQTSLINCVHLQSCWGGDDVAATSDKRKTSLVRRWQVKRQLLAELLSQQYGEETDREVLQLSRYLPASSQQSRGRRAYLFDYKDEGGEGI